MTTEKMTLKDMAAELDNSVGGLSMEMEVLDDIETKLLLTVQEMNNMKDPENLRIRFEGWHREFRILSQLMYRTMQYANEHRVDIKDLSEKLFEELVRKGK